jgi:hypothetical protein
LDLFYNNQEAIEEAVEADEAVETVERVETVEAVETVERTEAIVVKFQIIIYTACHFTAVTYL